MVHLKVFESMTRRTLIREGILTKLVESRKDEIPTWNIDVLLQVPHVGSITESP